MAFDPIPGSAYDAATDSWTEPFVVPASCTQSMVSDETVRDIYPTADDLTDMNPVNETGKHGSRVIAIEPKRQELTSFVQAGGNEPAEDEVCGRPIAVIFTRSTLRARRTAARDRSPARSSGAAVGPRPRIDACALARHKRLALRRRSGKGPDVSRQVCRTVSKGDYETRPYVTPEVVQMERSETCEPVFGESHSIPFPA